MEQFPNYSSPALTPEGLYSQDQKKRKWDEVEQRSIAGTSWYYLNSGLEKAAINRLQRIDEELEDLERQRRELYFERHRILAKQKRPAC